MKAYLTLAEYHAMIGNTDEADAEAQYRGAANKASGKRGQEEAEAMLVALGVRMVAEIATPIKVVGRHPRDKGYVRIAYAEKVAGDINGVMGDGSGRRVLCEVKSTADDKLGIGKLTDNQQKRLQENHELNGVSLVSWVAPHGSYILRWPVDGWRSGKPLDEDKARRWNVEALG